MKLTNFVPKLEFLIQVFIFKYWRLYHHVGCKKYFSRIISNQQKVTFSTSSFGRIALKRQKFVDINFV